MPAATPAEIRRWARDNGFAMPDRGPLSAEVKAAYAKAHGSSAKGPTAGAARSRSAAPATGAVSKKSGVRRPVETKRPVDRPAVKIATPEPPEADAALARTVADLSRRVAELEQQLAVLRAAQVRSTKRFGRRSP